MTTSADRRPDRVTATFRCYGELADLLPRRSPPHLGPDGRSVQHAFTPGASVKDRLEALGIPHTEVELVLVDGAPAALDTHLKGGERVATYPRFRRLPVPPELRATAPRPVPARVIADVHLATLARHLRLLGIDAVWEPPFDDEHLARRAAEEDRVLLTRDRGLLKRAVVRHGCLVRDDDPIDQVVDVVCALGLHDELAPFTRCLACNGRPTAVAKDEVLDLLEPATRREHDRFTRCPDCGRVYWPGTHHEQLSSVLAEILGRI